MTIYELIDRLKTAKDKNNDALVIVKHEDDYFIARHIVEVSEVEGNVFIDVVEYNELHVSNYESIILKPNRKEDDSHNPLAYFSARKRAEAERDRLNAEHRKEQTHGNQ